MTTLQLKVMKALFGDYKTPTMAECEMLGREIGLPKRVVQVWFQNARAKEKKNKLALAKAFGQDVELTRPPDDCKLCSFKYSHKYSIQDHIFTKKHIDNVKTYIINLKKFAEGEPGTEPSDSSVAGQAQPDANGATTVSAPATSSSPSTVSANERNNADSHAVAAAALAAGHSHLAQLHMMQMAAAGLPVPTSLANVNLPPGLAHTLTKDILSSTSAGASGAASTSTTTVTAAGIKQEPKEEKGKDDSGGNCKTGQSAVSAASGLPASLLNPFGDLSGLMSGDTAGLLPYMYTTAAGIPGYYPGKIGRAHV